MTIDIKTLRELADSDFAKATDFVSVPRSTLIAFLDLVYETNADLDWQTKRNNANRDINEKILDERARLVEVLNEARYQVLMLRPWATDDLVAAVTNCADIEPEVKQ